MGLTRSLWKITRLCLRWKLLIYLFMGILILQVFVVLNSNPNLLEEEKLRQIREARAEQHNVMAHAMLEGEKSILAGLDQHRDNINPHDPKIREKFLNNAKNNVDILEDRDVKDLLLENMNRSLSDAEVTQRNFKSEKLSHIDILRESPYTPRCQVSHKDAMSAISRAKSNACKQEISDVACLVQNGTLFPESMPRYCPHDYKYEEPAPNIQYTSENVETVRVCYMLVVHGRAVRQFRRLFKVLYHTDHFFYIHVDKRSDHLKREAIRLAEKFPNVEVAPWRLATIWGGSSLLQMLLRAMKDVLRLWKNWDFFINLSASDFPIEPQDKLVKYLTKYKNKNFMKSHGRDDEKFIRKQGLNRVFVECEHHMWRLGERELPKGITLNGGSDWVALNRDYCDYIVNGDDQLLKDLKHWYRYTLLPAESFFHTLAQNSLKCETFVDNNLRVTNWNRARGCKCQYKHIVDWCGCSPNDFYPSDISRLQTARPVFFARKFEESINQEVVNFLDFKLYGHYPAGTPAINSYWENCYDNEDGRDSVGDEYLTHYHSFARMGLSKINPQINEDATTTECLLSFYGLKSVEFYRHKEEFKGYVLTFDAVWAKAGRRYPSIQAKKKITVQTLISRNRPIQIFDRSSPLATRLEWAAVGTNWDVKELVLRDWGGIIGPLSDPRLVVRWSNAKDDFIVTVVMIDPLNVVADYNDFRTPAKAAGVTDTPFNLKKPLRPGKWKIRFFVQRHFQKAVAELTFAVVPLSFRKGLTDDVSLVTDNRGVIEDSELNSARRNLYSISATLNLPRDQGAERSLEERAAYVGEDLESWVDEVASQVWTADDICLEALDPAVWRWSLPSDTECFAKHRVTPKLCRNFEWSSFSPDPKSEIGPVQTNGRIR